jgi:hypothetical protein
MKPTKTLTYPTGRGTWKLEMNPSEVYPNDPGMGTPLLVIAPNGETSTLNCTLGEGVVSGDEQVVPAHVMKWLESVEAEAEAYVYGEQS